MRPSHPLFVSHKTSRAVPIADAIRRDFLIQSTLDGCVRSIDYRQSVVLDGRVVAAGAILLHRDDGTFVADFIDRRPEADPHGEGVLQLGFEIGCAGILELSDAYVRREPVCPSARTVWSFSRVVVDADDRLAVLDALSAEGPVPLRSLEGLVAVSRDMDSLVYAMACEGSVALDLRSPLDGRTVVRAGISSTHWIAETLRYGT